ncbi:MAG: hypothetical protein GXO63_01220 [Candidatus Micrarchaeota archaeon]|nr:hypothetical protein [Candidatus Micrarchaeota archaeon]
MLVNLVGIPHDSGQTFRKGASKAPELIKKSFRFVETNFGIDLAESVFVKDLGTVSLSDLTSEEGDLTVFIGGDHSITPACVKLIRPASVLVLDAHADCEESDAHDGVVRKIREMGFDVYLYGVRCFSSAEERYLENIRIVKSPTELRKMKPPVYLSVDLDFVNPGVLPLVGNPEPGGVDLTEIPRIASFVPGIKAIDFVEFTPSGIEEIDRIYSSLIARTIYQTIAVICQTASSCGP